MESVPCCILADSHGEFKVHNISLHSCFTFLQYSTLLMIGIMKFLESNICVCNTVHSDGSDNYMRQAFP
jgi:hypothetical protein